MATKEKLTFDQYLKIDSRLNPYEAYFRIWIDVNSLGHYIVYTSALINRPRAETIRPSENCVLSQASRMFGTDEKAARRFFRKQKKLSIKTGLLTVLQDSTVRPIKYWVETE
jgi:hypothetical protein